MPVIDQGFEETKYQIIPRTLIFLFDSNDQVLLIKGADTKHRWPGKYKKGADTKHRWPGKYNGIGGHIEGGEDILEAGLRELQEESGIKDVELSLIGQIMVQISDNAGIGIFILCGNYERSEFVSSKEGDLEWIKISELDKTPIVEDLPILLPRVISHNPCDAMIIGESYVCHSDEICS